MDARPMQRVNGLSREQRLERNEDGEEKMNVLGELVNEFPSSNCRNKSGNNDLKLVSKRKSQSKNRTDIMYEMAVQRKRDEGRREQELEVQSRQQARPRINRRSREIASSLGKNSQERILSLRLKNVSNSEPKTFSRSMNSNSLKLVKESPSKAYLRLYKEHATRIEKRERVAKESRKEKDELAECTFKPNISKYAPRGDFKNEENERVEMRLQEWDARRKERIAIQQRLKSEEDLPADCTFKPNIHREQKRRNPLPSAPQVKNPGVDSFLERQRKARVERERIKELIENPGIKWSGKATQAKAPNLITATRSRRKSNTINSVEETSSTIPSPPPPPPPRHPPPPPPESPSPVRDGSSDQARKAMTCECELDLTKEDIDDFALLRKLVDSMN